MTPREFAIAAHGSQRYGAQPYHVHLDAVAALVPPEHEAIAYLHDVLEDTDTDPSEIERLFGRSIRQCVELLTDPPGATRKQRKDLLHDRLRSVGHEFDAALVVKAADRLANVRASKEQEGRLAMYREEHDAFRAAAYRPALCDSIWEELDRLLGWPR